ncbi:hypothetical protein KU617_23340, partial [Salmonella enterica subsp. enterica serovar Montevideo]|nr:hypothetical protein [Salmonella enterica subsp. enterica serovar Montevideo]
QRVFAGVIHGGRIRQRRRVEVLHLIQTEAVALEPQRKIHHILLPSFEKVKGDKVLYAHASRILHHETNPGCARALMQKHGDR